MQAAALYSFDSRWNAAAARYAADVPVYPIQRDWINRLAGESLPGVRVADFGCGPGKHASLAADHGAAVTGIDASAEMLAIARARDVRVAWIQANLVALPFADQHFAHGLCLNNTLGVIPGAHNREAALAEIARVTSHSLALELLEEDGTRIIEESYFGGAYHAVRFSRDEIEQVARCWPLRERHQRPSKLARAFHLLIFDLR